ncbi:hypothetical protein [Aurantibacillus circumpalustris]|uniref:hypothetical protein n=1 Tax=Aurantibacillus circumpalustris TaxID=3036359 RepID=UPI00295A7A58|nr:hypothetical protein [Aurantibacillus circumpalustris]
MNDQFQIPLFPPDMMQKIKDAHAMIEKDKEIERLKKDLSHERHVKAGYIGAYKKNKK